MKKLITAIVSLVMASSLAISAAACTGGNGGNPEGGNTPGTEQGGSGSGTPGEGSGTPGEGTTPSVPTTTEGIIRAAIDELETTSYKATGAMTAEGSILYNGALLAANTNVGTMAPNPIGGSGNATTKDLTLENLGEYFTNLHELVPGVPLFTDGTNNPTDISTAFSSKMGTEVIVYDYANSKLSISLTPAGDADPMAEWYFEPDGNNLKIYDKSWGTSLYKLECGSAADVKSAFVLAAKSDDIISYGQTTEKLFKETNNKASAESAERKSIYDLAASFEKGVDGKTYTADIVTVYGNTPAGDVNYLTNHVEIVVENYHLTKMSSEMYMDMDIAEMLNAELTNTTDTLEARQTFKTEVTVSDMGTATVTKPAAFAEEPTYVYVMPYLKDTQASFEKAWKNTMLQDGTLSLQKIKANDYQTSQNLYFIRYNPSLKAAVFLTAKDDTFPTEYTAGKFWWLDGTNLKTWEGVPETFERNRTLVRFDRSKNRDYADIEPTVTANVTDFLGTIVKQLPEEVAISLGACATKGGQFQLYSDLLPSFTRKDLFTATATLYDLSDAAHAVNVTLYPETDNIYSVGDVIVDGNEVFETYQNVSEATIYDTDAYTMPTAGITETPVDNATWQQMLGEWKNKPSTDTTVIKLLQGNRLPVVITGAKMYAEKVGENVIQYRELTSEFPKTWTVYKYDESNERWEKAVITQSSNSNKFQTLEDDAKNFYNWHNWLYVPFASENFSAITSDKITFDPLLQMYNCPLDGSRFTYHIKINADGSLSFFMEYESGGFMRTSKYCTLYRASAADCTIPQSVKDNAVENNELNIENWVDSVD